MTTTTHESGPNDMMPIARKAMVLAAGLGTRMRPITDTTPKPLVRVGGQPMIDYALDALVKANTSVAVVNVHHLASQITAHLESRGGPEIILSDESERLLESGGGIRKALPCLGHDPFFVLNADTFWLEAKDEPASELQRLSMGFDPGRMDILLMTANLDQVTGHEGGGDFLLQPDGRLKRVAPHERQENSAVVYAGAAILDPVIFQDAPEGPFSLNILFDAAIAAGRLFGQPMRAGSAWITVGTPHALADAEARIARFAGVGPDTRRA